MENKQNNNFKNILNAFSSSDKEERKNIARQLMQNLNNEESNTLNEILSDKSKLQQIISSDAAHDLIERINKNKNG
jgi:hypothetical protein